MIDRGQGEIRSGGENKVLAFCPSTQQRLLLPALPVSRRPSSPFVLPSWLLDVT